MNSLTLPRWFGRRKKKNGEDDEPKPPEIVWLKEEPAQLTTREQPQQQNRTVAEVHRSASSRETTPMMPPSLDEVAEAKRKLRKAVSADMLNDDPDIAGFQHSYQNMAFNARVQNRPGF